MAIPLDKPPPPYVPASRPLRGDALSGEPPFLAGTTRGARVYRARVGWRGCLVAVALALAVLAAIGALGVSIAAEALLFEWPRSIVAALHTVAREGHREPAVSEALDQLSNIVEERRLGLVGAVVLINRYADAKADSEIDSAELDHLLALVRDVVAGNGTIDHMRYPDGR